MDYTNEIKNALKNQKIQILNSVENHKDTISSYPMAKTELLNNISTMLFGEDNILAQCNKSRINKDDYLDLKSIAEETYDEFETALEQR